MAIRTMTTKESFEKNPDGVEVVTNYPGHEAGAVSHRVCCISGTRPDGTFGKMYTDCAHRSDPEYRFKKGPDCDDRCYVSEPLYMRTTHVGKVLSLGERNGYDDSDFYAVVWDDEKNAPEEITYASTRGWTYPNGASVDATPEVVAKHEAWAAAVRESAREARVEAERRRQSRKPTACSTWPGTPSWPSGRPGSRAWRKSPCSSSRTSRPGGRRTSGSGGSGGTAATPCVRSTGRSGP